MLQRISFKRFMLLSCFVLSQPVGAETQSEALKRISSENMATLDLARVKLEIDHMIEPSTNVEVRLSEISDMAEFVRNAISDEASDWNKVNILRQFVYEGGHWNRGRSFAYDHDDPNGDVLSNKLPTTYLDGRLGNCITMPLLFMFVANGSNVPTLASAVPR